jgi:hypothetical protein
MALYEHALPHMREDFENTYQNRETHTDDWITNQVLIDLETLLLRRGTNCVRCSLPAPDFRNAIIQLDDDGIYSVEENARRGADMLPTLNDEQRIIYDKLIESASDPRENTVERAFYIDAPGGTGKTYTLNTIMHVLRGQGHIVLPTALTGMASSLYDGGKTVHSRFGVPVPTTRTSSSKFDLYIHHPQVAELLRRAKIMLIDEGSMGHKYLYRVVDRFLRLVTGQTDVLFGGKCVCICGNRWRGVDYTAER